jgi:glycosyltransferase involved in cell wall biosynthesis
MKRSLVILTWNEIEGVRALIPQLPSDVADEILAVDGGSTDGTREFLEKHQIPVYGQTRRGRGEAFRVGVANATGESIVFFSPDGNEDPRDIPKLFALLAAGADMAIASRFLPESQNEEDDAALPLRKWTNQAFTLMANLLWNRGRPFITDTINGFRGIRREAFNRLGPVSPGYTIEYELTIGGMRAGLKIAEIPTLEHQRIGGETKGASWPTGKAFLRFFLGQVKLDLQQQRYFWPYLLSTGLMLLLGWLLLKPKRREQERV